MSSPAFVDSYGLLESGRFLLDLTSWLLSLRSTWMAGLSRLWSSITASMGNALAECAKATARKDINADFVLRGHVKCADCGKPLAACWSKSKTGTKHPYYLCFSNGCDSHRKSIPREKLARAKIWPARKSGTNFDNLLQQLTRSERTFQIARAMLKHAWETRLAQTR